MQEKRLHPPINITQDWLSARAEVSPDKTAIITIGLQGDRVLTYRELANTVDKSAFNLLDKEIKKGSRVALLLPNIPYLTMIPELMRVGAIVVPLNTRLTPDEIIWQVDNTECDVVISTLEYKDVAQKIAQSGKSVYLLIGHRPDLNLPSLFFPSTPEIELVSPNDIHLEDPVAIIHTSGTSGTPKGAILTYNNIYQSAMASAYRIGVMPDDRWLCVLPLFHVGGLSIILRSLLYGTAVELMPKFDIDAVNNALTHRPITLVSLVPTMLSRLLDARTEPWNPKLRLVLLGGGAPSPELVARCVEKGIPLATTYGLSEASSQVATATLEQVVQKPASVGKPLMFTQVRVVDENDDELPANEIGEIIVNSPTIMQGYYNNPQATAKALRDGWLYTGDMGYKDEDGDLFIVQRRSDLIVTGGENVYPVEVENVIRQHPDIKEVVVVGIHDEEWGQKVVGAVQLEDEKILTIEEIKQFARDHLAGYKIPREICFVTDFPQTSSGKIQRKEVIKVFSDDPTDS
jgi:o-succinylbenzoate---CoA ligase